MLLLFTRENLQTVRDNTEVFIKTSNDIGLEINSEKTKYMITSRYQNVLQNENIVIGKRLKCGKVKISGSNFNKYKRHSRRNGRQNKLVNAG